MSRMFFSTPFNQPIGNWDVSNVTNMQFMFNNSQFNQDISNWDVSGVTSMSNMFQSTPFNQDISNWNVSNVISLRSIFRTSSMNCQNYTDTLVGWFNLAKSTGSPINVDVSFQFGMTFATSRSGGDNYVNAGESRTNVTKPVIDGGLGWTITNDTITTNC